MEKVREFIADHRGIPEHRITLDSTLFADLGLDGDDAEEFFADFFRKFQVDPARFDITRYFGGEGWPLTAPAGLIVRGIKFLLRPEQDPHERAGLVPIRVRDLVQAMEKGRWSKD